MKMQGLYILKDRLAVPVETIEEWAAQLGSSGNMVAAEAIGPYVISTVFLGIDHNFGMGELPILFETMIFKDSAAEEYQERCGTWEEAIEMHERAVAHVMALID
jgi:hypothetical protein